MMNRLLAPAKQFPASFRTRGLLTALGLASLLAVSANAQEAVATKAAKVPYPVASAANTGWALEFTHGKPAAVAVKDADGKVKWWWYMTFRVENREQEDHLFIPRIEVVTDSGHIYQCNGPVPAKVYNTIYKRCGNALTEPMIKIAGIQRPGKDFIHDSVVIWPAPADEDVDAFTVYVAGIYGETQPVNDPATGKPLMAPVKDPITGKVEKDAAGAPVMRQVELKRTLRLEYVCPGTGTAAHTAGVTLTSSDDVMR